MMYQADLGQWERGHTVEFEASNKEDALKKATAMLVDNEIVVELRLWDGSRFGKIVYDYYNWFLRE
jgi:hypothetical protein